MSSPNVDFVLAFPVKNEASILNESVRQAHAVIASLGLGTWRIVISVNASSDDTERIAAALANDLPHIRVVSSAAPGKGGAIRRAWEAVPARHYFFSDIDLSADLSHALPRMVALLQQDSDVVVGSRHNDDAVIDRPFFRRTISSLYRAAAHLLLGTRLNDLSCGLKGIRAQALNELLPDVQGNGWFFDSELILLAEARGYRVTECPVRWVEDRFPGRARTVPLFKTSLQYMREMLRIRPRLSAARRSPSRPLPTPLPE